MRVSFVALPCRVDVVTMSEPGSGWASSRVTRRRPTNRPRLSARPCSVVLKTTVVWTTVFRRFPVPVDVVRVESARKSAVIEAYGSVRALTTTTRSKRTALGVTLTAKGSACIRNRATRVAAP